MSNKHNAGKGDRYRPVDQRRWAENWDAIFGKRKQPELNNHSMRDFIDFFSEQEQEETRPPIIFCDMDGVLVDIIGGVSKILGRTDITNQNFDSIMDLPMKARLDKEHPHLFAKLPWKKDGKELWKYITKHKVEILSAHTTTWQKNCSADKKLWISKNLKPEPHFSNITRREFKKNHAVRHGVANILIDDFKLNIAEWTAHGGIGILHKNTADTIAALKKLGL